MENKILLGIFYTLCFELFIISICFYIKNSFYAELINAIGGAIIIIKMGIYDFSEMINNKKNEEINKINEKVDMLIEMLENKNNEKNN